LNELLIQLGYTALYLGTVIEGEGFILVAGFLAHRGYFRLGIVILLATLGAFSGDLLYFSLGRRYGRSLLKRSRRAEAFVPWFEGFMARHHVLWIFGMRYLYGVRWLGAALAGSTQMSATRFAALSLPACLLWALVVGLIGYGAGEMLERLLDNVRRYELLITVILVLFAVVYGIVARRAERHLEESISILHRDHP
jgi:membrane protein DedA with SNARE-associated domain